LFNKFRSGDHNINIKKQRRASFLGSDAHSVRRGTRA